MIDRFIRTHELPQIIGLNRRAISYLRADGDFPVARRIGKKALGFLESEVAAWMKSRPVVGGGTEVQG